MSHKTSADMASRINLPGLNSDSIVELENQANVNLPLREATKTVSVPTTAAGDSSCANKHKRKRTTADDPGCNEQEAVVTWEAGSEPVRKVAKVRKNIDGKKTAVGKKPLNHASGGKQLQKSITAQEVRTTSRTGQPNKLLKLLRVNRAVTRPMHLKSTPIGPRKISIPDRLPTVRNLYTKHEMYEHSKKVEEVFKPAMEVEIETEDVNPNLEIVSLPRSTKIIRVTTKSKGAGGETAHLEEIRKKPYWYPHIKIKEDKDARGCTAVTRELMEPDVLKNLRDVEVRRRKKSKKTDRGRGRQQKESLFEFTTTSKTAMAVTAKDMVSAKNMTPKVVDA